MTTPRRVALFSKEYPPHVYGGAGVHVEYLARALAKHVDVEVRCFGEQHVDDGRLKVRGTPQWDEIKQNTDPRFVGAIDAFARSLVMAKDRLDADLVHCHTWYTDVGGLLASQLWGVPYVLTIHSLEPLRPWKVEQLGNAYHLSAWMERTAIEQADAIIAVSRETRADVLRLFDVKPERVHVIHNGIDLDEYCAVTSTDVLRRHGIDPAKPFLLFVGRITRQKGIIHLVNAIPKIDPSLQIVLCAGAPDTPEIGAEMEEGVAKAAADRPSVIWIREMLPRADVIELYTHAAIFCCPSVYEPFGIINLEAMACGTAVVASNVGGIPEVVVPEETGLLVDVGLKPGSFEPADPAAFADALASAINRLAENAALRESFGTAGRARVEAHFSWDAIAAQTLGVYADLIAQSGQRGANTVASRSTSPHPKSETSVTASDYKTMPADLPKPIDDGAADHLVALRMPAVVLPSTKGGSVDLGALPPGRTVVFIYPMTGKPGVALPDGWDDIPGARGCTPQNCAIRDLHEEFRALDASVVAISAQGTADQREMAERLHIPYAVLSDADGRLAEALNLPTFEAAGMRLLKRLTLIVRDGRIEQAFYPVFPSDTAAEKALNWLRTHPM